MPARLTGAATPPYGNPYADGNAVGVESLAPAGGGAGLSASGRYADGIAVGVQQADGNGKADGAVL